jgi:nitroreductase
MKPNEFSTIVKNRRSVFPKSYTDEKIDKSIIKEMLENANWAPTHKLTQPWRFSVFEGYGIRRFAEFQAGLYKKRSLKDGRFDEGKYQRLGTKPLACSHIISIGMKRDPKECVPEIEEIAAVSCAVQNILLTASAYGVGCYWSTGGITYYPEALEFFDLRYPDKLMGFIMAGMPDGPIKEGRRLPIDDKVNWISE